MSNMKTEREQLEENTVNQYVKERNEALQAYLRKCIDEYGALANEYLRRLKFLMVAHIPLIAAVFVDTIIWLFAFLLVMICWARVNSSKERLEYKEGELDGAFRTLKALGMLDDDIRGKRRKVHLKKSPFKRFKEFWERVGTRSNKEAYGQA